MKIETIKTEEEYNNALLHLENLFEIDPKDENFEEVKSLIILIEKYEREHHRI